MYYSIPAVRSATMLLEDVDTSNLGTSLLNASHELQRNNAQVEPQKIVRRYSILSVECHPDLLLGNWEDLEVDSDETDNSLEEQFEILLR